MRVLKEVLVLAALVFALAYAARFLEGIDAGRIHAGVPSITELLSAFWSPGGDEPAARGSMEIAPRQ